MLRHICIAGVMAAALPGTPALAEELFPLTDTLEKGWGIGLGILREDEGYVGGKAETQAMPVVFYRGERFRLLGPQAEFRVWRHGGWSASLRGEYRFDGFDPKDDNEAIFQGMAKRESSLHAGFELKHEADWGHVTGEFLKSLRASKGSRASIYYAYPFQSGAWHISPKIGIERYDAKFTDYYYGVRADEETDTRSMYQAGASMNLDLGVDFMREFGNRHLLLASVKYRKFGTEIEDSPLVDASGSPRVTLAYVFRF